MWKAGTTRRIVSAPLAARPILRWSAASLLIAILAAIVGFWSGVPAIAGTAKIIALLFTLGFAALLVLDRSGRRNSG